MDVKLFEIRDRATFIAAMAVRLRNRDQQEFYLLRRAGYAAEQIGGREEDVEPYVLLTRLDGGETNYDVYNWGNRTMANATPVHHRQLARVAQRRRHRCRVHPERNVHAQTV